MTKDIRESKRDSSDTIYRRDAIDAVKKNTFKLTFAEEQNCEGHVAWSANAVYSDVIEGALLELPPAQSEQDREFIKLAVKNLNGRPYYSIIYLEFDDNGVGHDFEGYSSYSLDVISDFLKEYFMPFAQPEQERGYAEGDYVNDEKRSDCKD